MSNILSALSCGGGCDSNEGGMNSIIWIILLLCLCGGDNGLLGGGCGGNNSCGGNGGCMDGILPIILILCLCGGF